VSTIHPELRTLPNQTKQCQATISIAKKDDRWHIKNVVTKHSHDISPKKSRLIAGNRKVNMHARQTVDINDEARVRINKSFRLFVCEVGWYDNLVATYNPNTNGFSSPLSWRAQAYKMEVEEERDTKRKKG